MRTRLWWPHCLLGPLLAVSLSGGLLAVAFPPAAGAIDCTKTSTGFVPLSDLGTGSYLGYSGGLYGGGMNARPADHTAAGRAIAESVAPLDTLGQPDPNGRIVLVAIGMSNTTQEFSAFIPKANADPTRNPRVLVVNGAVGGWSADRIRTPAAAYWDSVAARLRRAGSSPLQAQIVWLKQANASPRGSFPASADTLRANLASIVRILHQKLPNVKLCYLTSRIYAGYATTALNPEPYAYESGFAVRWLLEEQLSGVDSVRFDPAAGPVQAPWLSWGPYLWADGMVARGDGLIWPCSFFESDGTHPGPQAEALVADSLLAFFKHDATAAPWFLGTTTDVPVTAPPTPRVAVYPVPSRGALTVEVIAAGPWSGSLALVSVSGRTVRRASIASSSGVDRRTLDVRGLPSGVYFLAVQADRHAVRATTRRIVILR